MNKVILNQKAEDITNSENNANLKNTDEGNQQSDSILNSAVDKSVNSDNEEVQSSSSSSHS